MLDVEPAHQYDQEGKRDDSGDQGQAVTPCPVKVRMFWNSSVGFVREETDAVMPYHDERSQPNHIRRRRDHHETRRFAAAVNEGERRSTIPARSSGSSKLPP